jgi:hypothetical protein
MRESWWRRLFAARACARIPRGPRAEALWALNAVALHQSVEGVTADAKRVGRLLDPTMMALQAGSHRLLGGRVCQPRQEAIDLLLRIALRRWRGRRGRSRHPQVVGKP